MVKVIAIYAALLQPSTSISIQLAKL